MAEASVKHNGKRRLLILLALLFVAIGAAAGGWWVFQNAKYISTDDARIGGTLVSVSAKVPGRISELLVKEGDQVKAGQVIARIDPKDVLAQKSQAEAALAAAEARYDEVNAGARPQEIEQARAGLNQAQFTLENAQKNYERLQELYQSGAISAAQRDSAETAYSVAQQTARGASEKLDLTVAGAREETIRAAAAQVKQAQAALDAINVQLENTTVAAPNDGTIALKSVNPGEVVGAGQSLYTIADLDDVWVNARIEETKIGKLRVGQTVEFTIDGYPGRTFTGEVYDIGSAANSVFALIPTENSSNSFTKVTQRIPIKISLPKDIDVVFRPGMSAFVKIHAG